MRPGQQVSSPAWIPDLKSDPSSLFEICKREGMKPVRALCLFAAHAPMEFIEQAFRVYGQSYAHEESRRLRRERRRYESLLYATWVIGGSLIVSIALNVFLVMRFAL